MVTLEYGQNELQLLNFSLCNKIIQKLLFSQSYMVTLSLKKIVQENKLQGSEIVNIMSPTVFCMSWSWSI